MADSEMFIQKQSDGSSHDSVGSDADAEEEKQFDTKMPRKKAKGKRKKKKITNPPATSDSDVGTNHMNTENILNDIDNKQSGNSATVDSANLNSFQKLFDNVSLYQNNSKSIDNAKKKNYEFWDTQPVPKLTQNVNNQNCAIDKVKTVEEIRSDCLTLPNGFEWDNITIDDSNQLTELYTLLNENYVEDDDNMFRFDYSPEFLKWALQPPGWKIDWHIGVRAIKSKKLLGFISAIPITIKIYEKIQKMVEINFLCVHKKLRAKRVAPVLIREITRRVNKTGIFQAVYTAGVVLPKPVATCRYWHRSLNPKKLIDVRFSHLSRNMTVQRTIRLYRLPEKIKTQGFRTMTDADIPHAYKLLNTYLNKFNLSPRFDLVEFKHWFTPRSGIINSFVVENSGKLTDFVSFYTLPSTIMHHPNYKSLKAAYSFYNVQTVTPWIDLMQDALIMAKNLDFDVFNALDLMDNKNFLEELKFGVGDGNLQYYLYNWVCPEMPPDNVGLVLQ